VNFFTTAQAARAWQADHPQVIGAVLDQQQAERLGRDIFGTLLA
jgi:hypothetical protein